MKSPILAAALVCLSGPALAEPRVWTVGRGETDFPLIAPAIAAASEGDEIRVRDGVYREDLVLVRRVSLIADGKPILFGTGNGTVIDVMADGCQIRGLIIDGTGTGATNQMDAAIRLSSSANVIAGNTMRRVFYGVVIAGGADNLVTGNEIEGLLHLPFGRRGDGIYVYLGARNRIIGNRIAGQRDAIFLQYSHDARVEGNTVDGSRYGLHDMFADDTVIENNSFRGCLVGANLMNSKRLTLSKNEFSKNRGVTAVGLSLKDCDRSVIVGNRFAANGRGVQLDGSSDNTFVENRFLQNDTAVRLLASAERNVFSKNEFAQNWSDVVESGANGGTTAWSRQGVGNRWSTYTGFDFDGDGVGESVHPLLRPFERVEGANALARLYLQSPAAGALDLVARSANSVRAASVDSRPLAHHGGPSPRFGWLAAACAFLFVALGTKDRAR